MKAVVEKQWSIPTTVPLPGATKVPSWPLQTLEEAYVLLTSWPGAYQDALVVGVHIDAIAKQKICDNRVVEYLSSTQGTLTLDEYLDITISPIDVIST